MACQPPFELRGPFDGRDDRCGSVARRSEVLLDRWRCADWKFNHSHSCVLKNQPGGVSEVSASRLCTGLAGIVDQFHLAIFSEPQIRSGTLRANEVSVRLITVEKPRMPTIITSVVDRHRAIAKMAFAHCSSLVAALRAIVKLTYCRKPTPAGIGDGVITEPQRMLLARRTGGRHDPSHQWFVL